LPFDHAVFVPVAQYVPYHGSFYRNSVRPARNEELSRSMVSTKVGVNRSLKLKRGDLIMNAIKLLLISFFVLCVSSTNVVANSVIDQTYPEAQAEVLETFGAIAQAITAGAGNGYDGEYMDQLISFHAYGPKFTEFNDGVLYDSAGK